MTESWRGRTTGDPDGDWAVTDIRGDGTRPPGYLERAEQHARAITDQVFLVWLREGKHGDAEIKVARASKNGAVGWCNEHRKLQGAHPIAWVSPEPEYGPAGEAKSRDYPGEYHYFIEPMPLGD